MAELAASGPHVSPVLHAVQFNAAHREGGGGATMNVHTGKTAEVGKDAGYAVGGAADQRTGRRIPTHTTEPNGSEPRLQDTLSQMQRVKAASAGVHSANVGSWTNDSGKIDFDASDVHTDRSHAERIGRARGEAAIFDIKRGDVIRTDN